jgi:hypothetical protein
MQTQKLNNKVHHLLDLYGWAEVTGALTSLAKEHAQEDESFGDLHKTLKKATKQAAALEEEMEDEDESEDEDEDEDEGEGEGEDEDEDEDEDDKEEE